MGKSNIEKLKKEFWNKFTIAYNLNPNAFELMRKVGIEQGKYLQKLKQEKKNR